MTDELKSAFMEERNSVHNLLKTLGLFLVLIPAVVFADEQPRTYGQHLGGIHVTLVDAAAESVDAQADVVIRDNGGRVTSVPYADGSGPNGERIIRLGMDEPPYVYDQTLKVLDVAKKEGATTIRFELRKRPYVRDLHFLVYPYRFPGRHMPVDRWAQRLVAAIYSFGDAEPGGPIKNITVVTPDKEFDSFSRVLRDPRHYMHVVEVERAKERERLQRAKERRQRERQSTQAEPPGAADGSLRRGMVKAGEFGKGFAANTGLVYLPATLLAELYEALESDEVSFDDVIKLLGSEEMVAALPYLVASPLAAGGGAKSFDLVEALTRKWYETKGRKPPAALRADALGYTGGPGTSLSKQLMRNQVALTMMVLVEHLMRDGWHWGLGLALLGDCVEIALAQTATTVVARGVVASHAAIRAHRTGALVGRAAWTAAKSFSPTGWVWVTAETSVQIYLMHRSDDRQRIHTQRVSKISQELGTTVYAIEQLLNQSEPVDDAEFHAMLWELRLQAQLAINVIAYADLNKRLVEFDTETQALLGDTSDTVAMGRGFYVMRPDMDSDHFRARKPVFEDKLARILSDEQLPAMTRLAESIQDLRESSFSDVGSDPQSARDRYLDGLYDDVFSEESILELSSSAPLVSRWLSRVGAHGVEYVGDLNIAELLGGLSWSAARLKPADGQPQQHADHIKAYLSVVASLAVDQLPVVGREAEGSHSEVVASDAVILPFGLEHEFVFPEIRSDIIFWQQQSSAQTLQQGIASVAVPWDQDQSRPAAKLIEKIATPPGLLQESDFLRLRDRTVSVILPHPTKILEQDEQVRVRTHAIAKGLLHIAWRELVDQFRQGEREADTGSLEGLAHFDANDQQAVESLTDYLNREDRVQGANATFFDAASARRSPTDNSNRAYRSDVALIHLLDREVNIGSSVLLRHRGNLTIPQQRVDQVKEFIIEYTNTPS